MTDIRLNVVGDASSGTAAMQQTSREVKNLERDLTSAHKQALKEDKEREKSAQEKADAIIEFNKKAAQEGQEAWDQATAAEKANLEQLKTAAIAAGAAISAFAASCVKDFMEAERITLQLRNAAGDLSDVFEQQADALEEQLHVDGEVIKQQQTLLLQWGAAPDAIGPAIKAVEDYAAAMGKDATTATVELIKAVETGGGRLKSLGIDFETTGDKSKDLAALTEALSKRFSGANAASADSLAGRVHYAEIAFGNLKETFGGFVGVVESKMGVLQKTADFFQSWTRNINNANGVLGTLAAISPIGHGQAIADMFTGRGKPEEPFIPNIQQPVTVPLIGPTGKTVAEELEAKRKAAEAAGKAVRDLTLDEEKLDEEASQLTETIRRQVEAWDKARADEVGLINVDEGKRTSEMNKILGWNEDMRDAIQKMDDFADKEASKKLEKQLKQEEEAAKRKAEIWQQAGDQIGAAFVNSLADQLSKLAQGGELDVATFVGDILATVVGVAATAIGTYFGAPAVGAAIGNLAAVGIRAGASQFSANAKKNRGRNTYHDGGWVGAPRHHDGSWIGPDEERAILQHGERVLSRGEVASMGGSAAVDKAAKGRSAQVVLNIKALDTKSIRDTFEGDGARGMRQALRSGRGGLPQLLGALPR